MSDTIIRVENLSKKYVLGHQQEGQKYKALRDVVADSAKAVGKKLLKPSKAIANPNREEFWALKDVSFEIKQGDRVGIIGRNGAGKSTLLKILSRIVEPTLGSIRIKGRVASLLEVGTGFHPELTGRENVFLNGSILGMSKVEIQQKFDEIVAFAEVEKFLDTPVKRYSSGMYVRLAFAVAAHLEPEVLIVDEVLAVGDANFQKKCLGKMQSISQDEGRTILFVSHQIEAIQRLCSQCILMERGQLVAHTSTVDIVTRYLSSSSQQAHPNQWFSLSDSNRSGSGKARFVAAQYSSLDDSVAFHAYSEGTIEFSLKIESDQARSVESLAVIIYDQTGRKLVNADTLSLGQPVALERGQNLLKLKIEQLHLNSDTYLIGFWLADSPQGVVFDFIESAFELKIIDLPTERFGRKPDSDGAVSCRFSISSLNQAVTLNSYS